MLVSPVFWGCKDKKADLPEVRPVFDKDSSYAMGVYIATSMNLQGTEVDINGLLAGMKDTISGKNKDYATGVNIVTSMRLQDTELNINGLLAGMRDTITGKKEKLTQEEAYKKVDAVMSVFVEAMQASAAKNEEKEIEFLDENKTKAGVITTPSGLQYEIIKEAAGPKPTSDNMVAIHYEGTLLDGTVFDSSYNLDEPMEFHVRGIGDYVPGWAEGLLLMSPGSKYKFYIPSELAYGAAGYGPIPPFATLIIETELFEIQDILKR